MNTLNNTTFPFSCADTETLQYWLHNWLLFNEQAVIVQLLNGDCYCAARQHGKTTVSFFTAAAETESLQRAFAHVKALAPAEVHLIRQFADASDLMAFGLDDDALNALWEDAELDL